MCSSTYIVKIQIETNNAVNIGFILKRKLAKWLSKVNVQFSSLCLTSIINSVFIRLIFIIFWTYCTPLLLHGSVEDCVHTWPRAVPGERWHDLNHINCSGLNVSLRDSSNSVFDCRGKQLGHYVIIPTLYDRELLVPKHRRLNREWKHCSSDLSITENIQGCVMCLYISLTRGGIYYLFLIYFRTLWFKLGRSSGTCSHARPLCGFL